MTPARRLRYGVDSRIAPHGGRVAMRLRCTPTPDDLLCCLGRSLALARVGPHHPKQDVESIWERNPLSINMEETIAGIGVG